MSPPLAVAAGLVMLAGGGELLIRGSAGLAARLGISSFVIGLTVVAFGTSAPELAVALQAVRAGSPNLALGNVVGSNIFNVLFILGISALIVPLSVSRRVVRIEVPLVIAVSALALACAWDRRIGAVDGSLLLGFVVGYLVWLLRTNSEDEGAVGDEAAANLPAAGLATVMVGAGLALLVAGADRLVGGAAAMARQLGVDEVVIGLTLVAAGTSLPEVAASVMATLRGHRDMAIGNVIGSSIFNLTVILGTTSVVAGGLAVDPGVLSFDFVVMVAVAVACLPIFRTGYCIARWEGAVFLSYYVAYTTYLVLDATEHPALARFGDAMVLFALPLTAVTLAVLMAKSTAGRESGGDPA